jgi:hypothetical protein
VVLIQNDANYKKYSKLIFSHSKYQINTYKLKYKILENYKKEKLKNIFLDKIKEVIDEKIFEIETKE